MDGKLIGAAVPRIDGAEKATGKAIFAGDVQLPRTLTGKVLRSPHAHARILNVDTSRAERLAGVKGVVTAKNVPEVMHGFMIKDQRILAHDRVRYVGEAVAAVAAVDEGTAEDALGLIEVDYEELPAVFDPIEAMRPDAPLVHEDFAAYGTTVPLRRYGNVCNHATVKRGDVRDAFEKADVIVEETYCTQMTVHCYLETHAVTADIDLAGHITMWMSSQAPFSARAQLAEMLRLPTSKIRVIAGYIGGGFGGKNRLLNEPLAVLLAKKTGRPVRIVMSRQDEFTSTNPRHPTIIWLKNGAMRDGTLIATEGRYICDGGAYADFSPMVASHGAVHMSGPYKVPNVFAEGIAVLTNKVAGGALRAPGVPQATFALESNLDILARKLGIDPIELRLKNAVDNGDVSPTGQVYADITFKKTLEAARRYYLAAKSERRPNRGIGIATGYWGAAGHGSGASVRLNDDGTITLFTGAVETGAGSSTAFAQVVADEFGMDMSTINVISGDTDSTPYDAGAIGTRTTYAMGIAVKGAAEEAKRQVLEIAASQLEANAADLQLRSGQITVKGSPDVAVSLARVAKLSCTSAHGPICASHSCVVTASMHDPSCVESCTANAKPHFAFATQIAEVEVDPETGQARVLRFIAVHDLGRVINRLGVEGQIEGGVTQGIGFAVSEKVHFDYRGAVANPSFTDYRLPIVMDQPVIESVMLEEPAVSHPLGVRGIGEPAIVPVAAAITNAVFDAVGVRVTELPISQETLAKTLRENGKNT